MNKKKSIQAAPTRRKRNKKSTQGGAENDDQGESQIVSNQPSPSQRQASRSASAKAQKTEASKPTDAWDPNSWPSLKRSSRLRGKARVDYKEKPDNLNDLRDLMVSSGESDEDSEDDEEMEGAS